MLDPFAKFLSSDLGGHVERAELCIQFHFIQPLAGLGVGIGFFLPFYIGKGMGAGDIKLMGAVGSMFGAYGALVACAASLVIGFIMVLVGLQIRAFGVTWRSAPAFFVEKNSATRVPYAPAISIGTFITMAYLGHLAPLATLVK